MSGKVPCTRGGEQVLYANINPVASHQGAISDSELAGFAMKAWLQAEEMEAALNKHTCNLERAFLFQGREFLSRYVPVLRVRRVLRVEILI